MIVKLIVNQMFTEPFKMKGNPKNVHLKTIKNVIRP